MDSTIVEADRQVEYISLVDSLRREWIKLPLACMQDVGPAVQTLGGLLKVSNKETFVDVATIAAKARLPGATVRKHLVTLDRRGWLQNKGRQETRRGRLRRTATIAVTAKARDNLSPYGVLPWWACGFVIEKKRKLSWGAKAVLSLVLARLMRFTSAAERQDGHGCEADDVVGAVEHMGGDDRFRMGLRWIERQTGLTRETVTHAKRELTGARLVKWYGGPDETGCQTRHIVAPNWEARIVVTPSGREGLVKLHIEEVSEGE